MNQYMPCFNVATTLFQNMIKEMEELVGDEVVDMDHFKETVASVFSKGIYATDSEESDDTEEEDQGGAATAAGNGGVPAAAPTETQQYR